MEKDSGRSFFTELGCDDCRYNQGKPEQPVCGHPHGVRMVFGARCVNRVSRTAAELLETEKKQESK